MSLQTQKAHAHLHIHLLRYLLSLLLFQHSPLTPVLTIRSRRRRGRAGRGQLLIRLLRGLELLLSPRPSRGALRLVPIGMPLHRLPPKCSLEGGRIASLGGADAQNLRGRRQAAAAGGVVEAAAGHSRRAAARSPAVPSEPQTAAGRVAPRSLPRESALQKGNKKQQGIVTNTTSGFPLSFLFYSLKNKKQ